MSRPTTDWPLLDRQLAALLGDERDRTASLANASALLFELLEDVNWVGFYLLREGELVLGPFQGRAACTRIAVGAGVCGTAAATRASVLVPDVHAFEGHIACDAASNAELVAPLLTSDGELLGVLDVDSPTLGRFGEADRLGLERVAATLVAHVAP
jgi:GAF domain-containing protein